MFVFDCSDYCWTWCGRDLPAVVSKLSSYDIQTALHFQAKGRWTVDCDRQEGDWVSDQLNSEYLHGSYCVVRYWLFWLLLREFYEGNRLLYASKKTTSNFVGYLSNLDCMQILLLTIKIQHNF